MKKRLLSSFLVLAMVLTLLPTVAFATVDEVASDGTLSLERQAELGLAGEESDEGDTQENSSPSITTFSATSTSTEIPASTIGGSSNPFKIGNATVLAELAALVNANTQFGDYSYGSAYYEMVANIDVSHMDWAPIGTTVNPFNGSFDGKTYTVTISADDYSTSKTANGLFGDATNDAVIIVAVTSPSADTDDGSTTVPADYTEIWTVDDLKAINNSAESLAGSYILMNDIDLGGNADNPWTPIGIYDTSAGIYTPFTGTFDGGGYLISGLYINTESGYQGLFGYVSGGTIQNVGVSGSVTGGSYVGGVVGQGSGVTSGNAVTVTNCYNTGTVSGTGDYVGGVVGQGSISLTIEGGYNTGTVSGTGDYVGGILGGRHSGSVTVSNCYNTGTISGTSYIGGVAGRLGHGNSANIDSYNCSNCYNTGTISGTSNIGGLVGYGYAPISNCYNTGTVSGTGNYVGGVRGQSFGTVSNCYNTGAISGGDYVGGVVGSNGVADNSSPLTNCVSLANSVTGSNNVGRVTGDDANDNNYAWSGMTVNGSTVTNETNSIINGADLYYSSSKGFFTDATLTTAFNWESTGFTEANSWTVPENTYQLPYLTDVSHEIPQNPLANLTMITITFGYEDSTTKTVDLELGGTLSASDIPDAPDGKVWDIDLTTVYTEATTVTAVVAEASVTTTGNETTNYDTLANAITAAGSSGTVKLLTDIETTATVNIYNVNKITLDLNGYDIKYVNNDEGKTTASVFTVIGELTLQDSNPTNRVRYGYWEDGDTYHITEDDTTVPTVDTTVDTLTGGVITGGTGTTLPAEGILGGGVYAPNGDFTMTGGTIAGNQATTGGGVYTAHYATITGGTICSNQADDGSGVYVKSAMKLEGDPIVQDVYLANSKMITLTGAYTGSVIPITTETTPSSNAPVTVVKAVTDYTITSADLAQFTYTGMGAIALLANEIQLVVWTYSADDDTLYADSDNNDDATNDGGSVTLSASGGTYTGSAYEATATKSDWIAEDYEIVYYNSSDTKLDSAPSAAGTYAAKLTLGGATASVSFTITAGSTSSGGSYYTPTTTTTTTTTDTTTNDDGSVTTTVEADTSTANGTTSATVDDDTMEDAIETAMEEADGEGAHIELTVDTTTSTDTVEVELTVDALESMADSDVASLTITTDIGSITMPSSALSSMAGQATGTELIISIILVDSSVLTQTQQTAVGDAQVYDLHITSGDENITEFGGAEVTVTLPYELAEDESAEHIVIWYLGEDGSMEALEGSYDEESGFATFSTPHLSYYAALHHNNPFDDVTLDDYFYAPVMWAVELGITNGTSDTTFSPNATCTRAQAVTLLWKSYGSPVVNFINPFTDVDADAYYYEAVLWAASEGITSGTSDSTFSPNADCTRGQIVTFLWNAAEKPVVNFLMTYSDVAGESWYGEAVRWAVSEGITSGTGATTFSPNADCTRGQIVTFLYRNMGN